ncbi:MAG TPA: matrixin family metalloprotease [Minicystis sp.]|nr:matrixin family metalloprotease [Minicystis sp.]
MTRLAWPSAAALAAVLATSSFARAYCRSSVCAGGVEGKVCTPSEPDDCGTPLVWVEPCVGFTVQKDASVQVPFSVAEQVLQTSVAAWTSAACSNGTPSIEVDDLGRVSCDAVEYNQHAGNANILIFRDKKWPYTGDVGATDTIALTTVTYDTQNGHIYDADIEVNTANYTFTTDGSPGTTDLQSVLTHESGHFLGLAHSSVNGATMFPYYAGGTDLRSLETDDIEAICTVYPLDRQTEGKCTDLPRHGFAPECAADQTETRCAATPGETGPRWLVAAWSFAALAALGRRRRRA